MSKKEKTKCGKLKQANCRVSEVKSIRPKHAQKYWKHQCRVETVTIRPLAGYFFGKTGVVRVPVEKKEKKNDYPWIQTYSERNKFE